MQTILTQYGKLIPQHTANSLRQKEILPVECHVSGSPKSVPLEHQQIITTPIGDLPAELVTFHKNGTLNRVFPLNGKLSGYWSEADESDMAKELTIQTPVGAITARMISVGFYECGALRSITMWPDETVSIETPVGFIEARTGISFSKCGRLRSLEPARPTTIPTPAGEVTVFDPYAIGVNGDCNSLEFDDSGTVCKFSTVTTQIRAVRSDGRTTVFSPRQRESYCSDSEQEPIPMRVSLEHEHLKIQLTPEMSPVSTPVKNTLFFSTPIIPEFMASPTPSCSI